jgi:hypothetical protein
VCPLGLELELPCVEADAQRDLGWLIAMQAAPFLSFPITHLVRSATSGGGASLEARVELTPERGLVLVGGSL